MSDSNLDPSVHALFQLFDPAADPPRLEAVEAHPMPEPYRRLLVHHEHMTVTMESFYRSRIELRIIQRVRKGNLYARKILLAASDSGQIVQFGIMRFDFGCCSEAVRDDILAGDAPLGYILIRHNVLRRIDVHRLLKIETSPELTNLFDLRSPAETYGRLATIFCNEKPAVELLEIPAPVRP